MPPKTKFTKVEIIRNKNEEVDSDSECDDAVINMPVKSFKAIIKNNRDMYEQCYEEGIALAAKLKLEKSKAVEHEAALKNLKQKNVMLENEINVYKDKIKISPETDKILKKYNNANNYVMENKQNLIDKYYQEHKFNDEIEKERKRLKDLYGL